MNAGHTSERVYDALKERLLSGSVPPGERLEPAAYADALGSSATPVRDALHRLAGEHLVEMRLAEGFFLPRVTESGLRSLYLWNLEIVRIALRQGRRGTSTHPPARPDQDHAATARALFSRIAVVSGNSEIVRAIDAANDRLATARIAESHILPQDRQDLGALQSALRQDDRTSAARQILLYHRIRIGVVPQIVQALHGLS
ncbi:MAG: GntR family transcriptional regulator [Candidatus Sphingomonas phytovorans]|nr:GntR family transcriptional regulator [Sphingomonas sp.]WEK02185.1 MAG: GntR family transcriptional regulator [Sphingomonas sp.]